MGLGRNRRAAVLAATLVMLSLGTATASSSPQACTLGASTLRPAHVTSESAVLRGRVTACGAHAVTAWFIVDGSRGDSFAVLHDRRPVIEKLLLVNLVHGTHVTYRMAVEHGGKVVRGRLVKFTTP